MRKILLILIALFLMGSLLAIPTLKVIKTHDYTYVNRIVIVFSGPVKYQIGGNSADKSLQIRIRDASKDQNYIEPRLTKSQIVQSINVELVQPGLLVKIQTGTPYRTEMMTLNEEGYKIVIDIFQKETPATYEAGLSVANFYVSTHQFNKAKPLYSKLGKDFPDKTELNYYIAKNLVGMKKYSEALAQFEKVPETSREYQFAQILGNKLRSLKNYADFQQDFLDSDFDFALSSPPPVKEQTATNPEVTFETVKQPKPDKPSVLTFLTHAQVPLWLAFVLMVLVIVIYSIMLGAAKDKSTPKTSFNVYKDSPKEPTMFVDEESKRKMISKFLHDGWSNREIAKELHISESEVESAVKQLSVSDF